MLHACAQAPASALAITASRIKEPHESTVPKRNSGLLNRFRTDAALSSRVSAGGGGSLFGMALGMPSGSSTTSRTPLNGSSEPVLGSPPVTGFIPPAWRLASSEAKRCSKRSSLSRVTPSAQARTSCARCQWRCLAPPCGRGRWLITRALQPGTAANRSRTELGRRRTACMIDRQTIFQPLFTLPETVPAPFSDHGGPLEPFQGIITSGAFIRTLWLCVNSRVGGRCGLSPPPR
jgi:hypothetical protein